METKTKKDAAAIRAKKPKMRNICLTFILSIFLFSCQKKSKVEQTVEEIPLEIKIDRFDKAFFETPVSELPALKQKYPHFFTNDVPDSFWTNKMSNPQWRQLYDEVQKVFGDFSKQKAQIEDLFRHMKYYFPKSKTPKVTTLIYEMDSNYKTIYTDSLVIVSLEMYLGKNSKFYEYPVYQKQNFEPLQICPDIVQEFSQRIVKPPVQKDLISLMIYNGKQLYLKDILLPEFSNAEKIGYTPEQDTWCVANESNMWRYFIDQKLLFETDPKLAQRFIAPAPFSKFNLDNDSETPGRVGQWLGWQIVKSYMENNKTSLQELMSTDSETIFKLSKYKPSK